MPDTIIHPTHYQSKGTLSFQALGPLGGDKAYIRFEGTFQGEQIIWDARLFTLEHIYRQQLVDRRVSPDSSITLTQFMDIKKSGECQLELSIGLAVPAIDEPTVFKSIYMIHNYKRLHLGRHDFGPTCQFP